MNRLAASASGAMIWAVACAAIVAMQGPASAAGPDTAKAPGYLGPSALAVAPDGRSLYVSAADAGRVLAVDLATNRVTGSLEVPDRPSGMVFGPDGTKLYVTCAAAESRVVAIDTAAWKIAARFAAGHTAIGPVMGRDGRLFVCNRFDDEVAAIDPLSGKTVRRVRVTREPVAAALTRDGRSLLVANHLPTGRADAFYVAPVVSVVDTATGGVRTVTLPNGSTGLRGVCLTPDGRYALVTHILSNYELVPSQVVGGWTNINALSVIDTGTNELLDTLQLDDPQLGAANPWGVACSADGRWLCVAHSGTDELSVIELPRLLAKLGDGTHVAPTAGGVPNSPAPMAGLRRRVKLPGHGPRAVAIAGGRAYVAEYFSDDLAVVALERGDVERVIALGPRPVWTPERRGEVLFHDATICYQHWQSCASCHPDARTDSLNWDLTNDGVGNPKNTKSMLLAPETPPAMSLGVRDSSEAAVRSGLKHILFASVPESDAAAIDRYLESLRAVPSPRLVRGELSASARRGKELFESRQVGCAGCHPAPLYTDRKSHDVGTLGANDPSGRYDTPSLVEAWRTAPYLHDGRCATMTDLLVREKHGLSDGRPKGLSRQQIDDLVAFVLSL